MAHRAEALQPEHIRDAGTTSRGPAGDVADAQESLRAQVREAAALCDTCSEALGLELQGRCQDACGQLKDLVASTGRGTMNPQHLVRGLREIYDVIEEIRARTQEERASLRWAPDEARAISRFASALARVSMLLGGILAGQDVVESVRQIESNVLRIGGSTYALVKRCPDFPPQEASEDFCQQRGFSAHCGRIARGRMPQVPEAPRWAHIARAAGISYEITSAPLSRLRGMQSEIKRRKVEALAERLGRLYVRDRAEFRRRLEEGPPFITSDHRVLDGHHRFAALLQLQQQGTLPANFRLPVVLLHADQRRVYEAYTNTAAADGTLFKDMNDDVVGVVAGGKRRCLSKLREPVPSARSPDDADTQRF